MGKPFCRKREAILFYKFNNNTIMSLFTDIKNLLIALAVLIIFGGGMFYWGTRHSYVEEPILVPVEVPQIGPIATKPVTLKEVREYPVLVSNTKVKVDSSFYYKYKSEESKRKRLEIFLEAIIINDTVLTVVDNDTIRIDVTSKTRGQLIEQFAKYTIKERSFEERVTIKKPKYEAYLGGGLGLPVTSKNEAKVNLNFGGVIKNNKNDVMFSLNYSSSGYISIGYYTSIFKNNK